MQVGQAALVDDIEGALERGRALGRETCDQIGAEDNIGPRPAQARAQPDRVVLGYDGASYA